MYVYNYCPDGVFPMSFIELNIYEKYCAYVLIIQTFRNTISHPQLCSNLLSARIRKLKYTGKFRWNSMTNRLCFTMMTATDENFYLPVKFVYSEVGFVPGQRRDAPVLALARKKKSGAPSRALALKKERVSAYPSFIVFVV